MARIDTKTVDPALLPASHQDAMPSSSSLILVKAGTLVDGENIDVSPGGLLLERPLPGAVGYKIVAVDSLAQIQLHPLAERAQVIDCLDSVVCPALVNAHAHLDLTHIGPWQLPEDGGFQSFVAKVRQNRRIDDAGIRASVKLGIDASRRGGVVAVGDIAGAAQGIPRTSPLEEMVLNHFAGTSYVEFFALGNGEEQGIRSVRAAVGSAARTATEFCKLGIHPHAPYSVSLRGYRAAMELRQAYSLPMCSHVAESLAERQFVASGTGPLRDFLESIGLWNGTPEGIGEGKSPVAHLSTLPQIDAVRLVHLNNLSDQDIEMLATGSVAVYCPRSSQYFGAEVVFGPHRYRELIRRGVKVALGTDSILNLVDQPSENPRISTWDEMRLLFRRDGGDPRLLLKMATTWGAEAIEFSQCNFEFKVGLRVIDLIGIISPAGNNSLGAALLGSEDPKLLLDSK